MHGSVKNRLMWNTPPENVPFDPVLVTLAEVRRVEINLPFYFDHLGVLILKGFERNGTSVRVCRTNGLQRPT